MLDDDAAAAEGVSSSSSTDGHFQYGGGRTNLRLGSVQILLSRLIWVCMIIVHWYQF